MTKKVSIDDLAEALEPIFDERTRELFIHFTGRELPKLAEEAPFLKLGISIGRIFKEGIELHQTKMMLAFLAGMRSGQKTMDDFNALTSQERSKIRSIIISELDKLSDERQAEAVALAVEAYLSKKIDWLLFIGILPEIKNTNPLLYYFGVETIQAFPGDGIRLQASGPTHLLPSAFGTNPVSNHGWSGIASTSYIFTNIGEAFYLNVYLPMSKKYEI